MGNMDTLMQYVHSGGKVFFTNYGSGKFMVYNGTFLNSKESRGLITGGVALLNDTYIYPIMNFELLFIDDFPAPIPAGYNNKINKEYGRDINGFYRDIWWPDMLKEAKSIDASYNGAIIETYNNKVKPKFINDSDQQKNLLSYGREVLSQGGELGLHGYNHQSLVLKGFLKEDDLGYTA